MPIHNPPVDEVSRFAALYDKVSRPLRDLTPAGRETSKKSKYNLDMRTLNPALVQERRNVRKDIGVDGPRHVDNDAVLQRAVTRQRNRAIVGLRNPGNEGAHPEMPGYRLEYLANVCALEEEDRISGTAVANRVLDSKSTVADALHRHGDNAMRRRNLEDNLAQWQVKMGENVASERIETLAREEEMEKEAQETTIANLEVEAMGNTFKDTFDRLTQLNFFVERVVTDAKHNLEVKGAFRRPTKSMGTATDLSFFSGIKATTTSTLDHSDDEGGEGGNHTMATSTMSSSVAVGANAMGASKQGSPMKGDKDKAARILEEYEEKINELQGRLGRRTEALINALKMVEAVEKQHKRNERSSDKTIRSKDDEMLRLRMYIEALETGVGFTQRWEWRGEAGEDDDSSATKFIATAMQIARDEAKKEHQKAMVGKQRDVLEASRRRDILNYVEHEDSAMQLRDQMTAVERSRDQLRELLETAEETVERQADMLTKVEAECVVSRSKLLVADSDLAASVKQVAELKARNEELETTLHDTLSAQEGTQLDAQELLDERDAEVEKLRHTVAELSQGLHMATLEQEIVDLRTISQQHAREASDLRERNTAVKKLNGALETRIKALENNEMQMMETVCQVASSMLRGVTEERSVLGKKVPPLQLTSRPIYPSSSSPNTDTTPPSQPLSPAQPSLLRSPRSNSGADNARVLVADRKHASSVVRFHFVSQNRLWELTSTMAEELDNLVRSVAAPLIQSPDIDAPHIDCGDGERLPDTTAGRVLRDLRGMMRQSTPAHFQQVESHLRVVVDDTPLAAVPLHPYPHVIPELELVPLIAPSTPTYEASNESIPDMGTLLPIWADDVVRLQAIVTKVGRLLALRTTDQQLSASSASNALWALRGMSAALANEVAAPIYRLRLRQGDPAKVVAAVVDGPLGPINVDSHLQEVLTGIPGQVSRCLWRKVLETVRARRSLLNKCKQAEVRVATAMARLKEATYQNRHNATSPAFTGLESVLSVAHISVRALVQSYVATFPSRSPVSRSRPTSAVGGPSRGVSDALLNMGRTLDEIREAQDTYGGVVGSSGGGAWLKWFDMDSELHPPHASMLMSSEDGRISALHRQRLRLITELQAIDDVDTRFMAKQALRNQAILDALGGSSTLIESSSRPPSAAVPTPSVHVDETPTTTDSIAPPNTPPFRNVVIDRDVSAKSQKVPPVSVDVPTLPVASSQQSVSPRDRHSHSVSHTAPHSPRSSTQGNSPLSTTRSVGSDQDPKEMASTCRMERTASFRPNNSGTTVAPTIQPITPHPTITPAATVATHQLVVASVREAIQQIAAALKESPKGYHAPFDLSRGAEVQAVINRIRRASVGADVPNLQRADDVVAQLYPKVLAAIAQQAPPPVTKPPASTFSVYTQCELPPAADSPWIRGRELAERIVSRNRPTSASSSHGRPTSAPSARSDVYSDVVETLMPTYSMATAHTLGPLGVEDEEGTMDTKSVYSRQSSVLNRLNSGDHSEYTDLQSEAPCGPSRPASRPASAQHRGNFATPKREETSPYVKQLVEENQVLATHVQNLQQHITEVKKNLKTFLQQAVGENIMRPLPDGTWARESELTFTEKPAKKPDRVPKVDLVVSDPMRFMLRRDTSGEDGVVLRGASGRPLFVPRRIPQSSGGDTLVNTNDFYPPASPLHTRPPSAGGLPMLQQQVLRHISDHVSLAVSDVSVGTDGIEAEFQPPILSRIPTNGVVDVVVAKEPPLKVVAAQTSSSTQTPDELLSMYVMRLSAGLTPSGVPVNRKAKPTEPTRQASPMDQLRVQPSGVLLRPVSQTQPAIGDRSWTVDNPAASSTPVRRVTRPTVPDGAISVPLGGNRVVSRGGISSAATRVNCPPVFTSAGATDGEQNTGPFSERQINLYPPHRHWSDRTDDTVDSA